MGMDPRFGPRVPLWVQSYKEFYKMKNYGLTFHG